MQTDTKKATSHETALDVTGEQIGRVYAEAFLGAAETSGSADAAVGELEAVVAEVIDANPKFAEAVGSAFLSHEDRTGLIDRVLGGRVSPVVVNTLKVLSQHDRMPVLRTVAKQARGLFDQRAGRVPVQVTSAVELTPEMASNIEASLKQKLGGEPVLSLATDPELIGGLTIRVGDTIYDGSVRTVFDKARKAMIEDTVAKIEQNPESFLSSTTDD